MVKLSKTTVKNIRNHLYNKLSYEMEKEESNEFLNTEVLFYTLTDGLGMSNECAKFFALKCHSGGKVFDAEEVRTIIKRRWKAYELNPKQSARFVNIHMMKSSRFQRIGSMPYIWELNGFATNQPPYIAGYQRKVNA